MPESEPTPSPEIPPDPPVSQAAEQPDATPGTTSEQTGDKAREPVDPDGKRFIIKGFKKKIVEAGMLPEFTIEWAIFKEQYEWPESWRRLQEKLGPEVLRRLEVRDAERRDGPTLRRKMIRELTKKIPVDKVAMPREIASWVANHLSMEPTEIAADLASIPCRGALEMLATASSTEEARKDFLYTQLPRMMSAKDNERGPADKQGNVQNKRLIDLLRSQVRPDRAAGNGSEQGVSPQSDPGL